MAKFSFYDITILKIPQMDKDGNEIPGTEPSVIDHVNIEISKKVNNSTMRGEKGELYKVSVADLPGLFMADVKFPGFAGNDPTARITAVKAFLDKYIGKTCQAEEISKGKRRLLSYIEFE